MRTVAEIIKDAGGARAIADASVGSIAGAIKPDAVYKWPSIGIPDRHWPTIIGLTGCTPKELYDANVAARAGGVAA